MVEETIMANLNDLTGANVPEVKKQEKTVTQKEIEALQLETAKLDFEAKQLEIKERKANLQDMEERLAERDLKRETKRQKSLTNGQTLMQLAANDNAAQKRCNHRKGGDGAHAVVAGQGQDSQYAVLKHIFANGDMWVRCLRCAKTWKPPVKESYADEAQFLRAVVEYETAVNFTTRNVTSGAVQFRFSDNGDYYRRKTANSNLR
jgi:hypothetical protein